MTKKLDAERFLSNFSAKCSIYELVFYQRGKNQQALADLETTPHERLEYILQLKPEHYCEGPCKDTINTNFPDYWVFGIEVKGREVYVKLSLGPTGKPICMSFHPSERPLNYPFKPVI